MSKGEDPAWRVIRELGAIEQAIENRKDEVNETANHLAYLHAQIDSLEMERTHLFKTLTTMRGHA
jgi:hypothetical protein